MAGSGGDERRGCQIHFYRADEGVKDDCCCVYKYSVMQSMCSNESL